MSLLLALEAEGSPTLAGHIQGGCPQVCTALHRIFAPCTMPGHQLQLWQHQWDWLPGFLFTPADGQVRRSHSPGWTGYVPAAPLTCSAFGGVRLSHPQCILVLNRLQPGSHTSRYPASCHRSPPTAQAKACSATINSLTSCAAPVLAASLSHSWAGSTERAAAACPHSQHAQSRADCTAWSAALVHRAGPPKQGCL